MAKPTDKFTWSESLPAASVQPDATHLANGWAAGEKPPAEFFNWLFRTCGKWISYLDTGSLELGDGTDATPLIACNTTATAFRLLWEVKLPGAAAYFVRGYALPGGVVEHTSNAKRKADGTWDRDTSTTGHVRITFGGAASGGLPPVRVRRLGVQAANFADTQWDTATEDSAKPLALTRNAGWAQAGGGAAPTTAHRDASGRVHLSGVVTSPGTSGDATILTLPAGYRPAVDTLFFPSYVSPAASWLMVRATGVIEHGGWAGGVGGNVDLHGVSFPTVG